MPDVVFSVDAGVARITINRPGKRNTLTGQTIRELRQCLQKAEEDDAARVVALTGAGEQVFCAGLDLRSTLSSAAEEQKVRPADYRNLLLEITGFPKPTVTLVRGHVLGGGIGIVLASDLCIACDDVHFSTPEIQVGMFPMMVLGLLYRNVGRKKATEMMFLGESITAAQAREYGIINHACSRDRFDEASGELLQKLSAKSPTILALGKKAISRFLDEKLAEEESFLESALAEVMETEDSKEGIQVFLEKRRERFS
ncbi:MAG: enoyl-CoA hydratase/isomerase family protein [Acidobacteria bacterium]|nr:enoyl-CoA hydratase/isomerase family protein [Acidobacteriota bacterium]